MKFIKFLLITWSLSLNAGLPPLPSPAGNAGKFLTNDGTKMSWGSASGTIVAAPGTVLTLAAATCPTGTLLADGSAISRTTYSDLFASIGTTHGSGDGTTTFNLPDYRGRFLRGVDGGTGRDPNAASRTAMATGGNTGNAVGSVQDDAFQGHAHGYYDNQSGTGSSGAAGTSSWRDLTTYAIRTDGVNGTPRTAAETRPINANVIYCVVTTSLATATASYTPGQQVFTSSGTFTIPTGVTSVKIIAVGGGGGGGGGNNTNNPGGGGGGGGAAIKLLSGLVPGKTLTVTVGAAGSAGTGGGTFGTNGGSGGASSVTSGTQIISTIQGNGGSGGNSGPSGGYGGSGGTATGGDINIPGGKGRGGSYIGTGGGDIIVTELGDGADSLFGMGGKTTSGSGTPSFNGVSGTGYGAGGSGGIVFSSAFSGGAGTAGVVIIEW